MMYRSSSPDAEDRIAVRQSFAESVLWGFTVVAEENDATSFFLRDAHGISERMQATGQGSYQTGLTLQTQFVIEDIVVEHLPGLAV
jgi:hypothetical protein